MMDLQTSWATLKNKELPLRYVQTNGNYYIYGTADSIDYVCVIAEGSESATDFETHYKDTATNLA